MHNLGVLFVRHEQHAQLALRYPDATVVKDTVFWGMVDAYRKTFRGQLLKETAFECMRQPGHGSYGRAVQVASDDRYIVFPKAGILDAEV